MSRLAVTSRAARSFSPRRSKRARISPARFRSTASGFARMSVRSRAMRPRRLPGTLAARRALWLCELDGHVFGIDRRLAVRAHLPERLERLRARHARLPELGRADGADEEVLVDLGAADGAVEIPAAEALLHRLDLELALTDVFQILGRPEEHVD